MGYAAFGESDFFTRFTGQQREIGGPSVETMRRDGLFMGQGLPPFLLFRNTFSFGPSSA